MIKFAPCKINLGLNILGKRPDGYHALETVMYQVPFYDVLEMLPTSDKDRFFTHGLPIPGDSSDNLVLKALALVRQQCDIPPVEIHLLKNIPMGGGLGGGSSNGTTALLLLNELFMLGLSDDALRDLAAQLGSDCPLFVSPEVQLATGRGEFLRPIDFSLKGHYLVLLNMGAHISTKEAFAGIAKYSEVQDLERIVTTRPVREWKTLLHNDFEQSAFAKHPALAVLKEQLYAAGALYAAMTGSGSTLFGIFEQEIQLNLPETYFCRGIQL